MEYVTDGHLYNQFEKHGKILSEDMVQTYLRDLCNGLSYIQ